MTKKKSHKVTKNTHFYNICALCLSFFSVFCAFLRTTLCLPSRPFLACAHIIYKVNSDLFSSERVVASEFLKVLGVRLQSVAVLKRVVEQ